MSIHDLPEQLLPEIIELSFAHNLLDVFNVILDKRIPYLIRNEILPDTGAIMRIRDDPILRDNIYTIHVNGARVILRKVKQPTDCLMGLKEDLEFIYRNFAKEIITLEAWYNECPAYAERRKRHTPKKPLQ